MESKIKAQFQKPGLKQLVAEMGSLVDDVGSNHTMDTCYTKTNSLLKWVEMGSLVDEVGSTRTRDTQYTKTLGLF